MRYAILGVILALVLVSSALADGVPDWGLSQITMAPAHAVLTISPDGGGDPFTQAHDGAGGRVDATVTLHLLDWSGVPIVNYPREDIWLEALDGGMVSCYGWPGMLADQDTDFNGMTVWADAPRAGGWSSSGVICYVSGNALTSPPLDLWIVSPDISGDGRVDLSDAGMFASDRAGAYALRSDLNGDGVINISDAGIMGNSLGAVCP
jgi:hypothetical protein